MAHVQLSTNEAEDDNAHNTSNKITLQTESGRVNVDLDSTGMSIHTEDTESSDPYCCYSLYRLLRHVRHGRNIVYTLRELSAMCHRGSGSFRRLPRVLDVRQSLLLVVH